MFTQPTRQVTFNLEYKEPIDFDLLDDWLTSVLKIETQDHDNSSTEMASLINRKLLFIRSLLQAVALPCFDSGSILNLEQNLKTPSKWTAKVAIVNIEHIQDVAYQIIINFVFKTVNWMMKNSKTPKNIEYLYKSIKKEVIDKLNGIGGSGKSTIPILRAAHQQNIPFFHLGGGTYQLGNGNKLRKINRSTSDLDSNIGAKMSNDKMMTSNLVRMAGLPAPVNGLAVNIENATTVAHKIGWPVVVKPVDADRGEGVTIDVTNDKQLKIAFEEAKRFSRSKKIIVEREVQGVTHRIFIANGKLLYAVKRLPISIEGDGHKQVTQLIQEANQLLKNEPPWLRSEVFPDDDEAIHAMTTAGFSLTSIPKDGELVPLRIIESTASGGHNEDFTTSIHPDNVDISIRAAELFGLEIAGIDIISTDIKKPWHENGAIINEVNFAPLLGRGEVSKNYIPAFLEQILGGDGRIPIDVVIGGSMAMDAALKEQSILIKKGIACFLTSHNVTVSGSREGMIIPFRSIYKRCKALLMNHQVESIILVVQTDEFLYTGMPVDKITNITITGGNLVSSKNVDKKLPQEMSDRLLSLINNCKI